MRCTYTLTLNGKVIKENVDEMELNKYINDNIDKFANYDSTMIRYKKSTREIILDLEALRANNKIAPSDKIPKEFQVTNPDLGDYEGYGSNYKPVLKLAEELSISDRQGSPFNLENWKENRAKQYISNPELITSVLSNFNTSDFENNPAYRERTIQQALKAEMESWDKIMAYGRGVHYLASIVFNHSFGTTKQFVQYARENFNGGSEEKPAKLPTDKRLDSIIQLLLDFKKLLLDSGYKTFMPGFTITGTTKTGENLRGTMDLLAIKEDGSMTIFDFKLSSTPYKYWDVNKRGTYDYQLGLYRILLAKTGIPSASIDIRVVPIQYSGTNDDNTILNVDEAKPITIDMTTKSSVINSLFDLEAPVLETPIYNKVTSILGKIFGREYFTLDIITLSREDILKTHNPVNLTIRNPITNKTIKYDGTPEGLDTAVQQLAIELHENVRKTTSVMSRRLSEQLTALNTRKGSVKQNAGILDEWLNKSGERLDLMLMTYRNAPGWRVITNDDLSSMGIILLVNPETNQMDVISVTANDLFAMVTPPAGGDSIYNFKTKRNDVAPAGIMRSTVGNIETIKALAVIDLLLQDPQFLNYLVNDIKAISLTHDSLNYELNMQRAVDTYKDLNPESTSAINVVDPFTKALNTYMGYDLFKAKIGLINENAYTVMGNYTRESRDGKIRGLRQLLLKVAEEFFKGNPPDPSDNSAEAWLYQTITANLASLEEVTVDVMNSDAISSYGLNLTEWMKGKNILNGTEIATIDTIPIIKNIFEQYRNATRNISTQYTYYKDRDRAATDKIISKPRRAIGYNTIVFLDMINTDNNQVFKVYDPDDMSSPLNEEQREYLRYWLKSLNEIRFNKAAYDEAGWEEVVRKAKEGYGTWFDIPLANPTLTSKFFGSGLKNTIKSIWGKNKELVTNPADYLEQEIPETTSRVENKNSILLDDMYNVFRTTDVSTPAGENRRDLYLSEAGDILAKFETNLELVKDSYIFAKIMEQHYSELIPKVNDAITLLAYITKLTGKPTKELIVFIRDFMNRSVLGRSLVGGPQTQNLVSAVLAARNLSSMAILGVNFLSGIKETAVGFHMLFSRAMANTLAKNEDLLSLKDTTYAYLFVWRDSFKQINNVTLLEHLNRIYQISNTGVESLVGEGNYSTAHAFRFRDKLFWCNRAPDFLNRMTILVGFMHKYGCLEAYETGEDGLVRYDWRKDKRFDKLAAEDKSDLAEYNRLKGLYESLRLKFIKEHHQVYDEKEGRWRDMTLKDELPDALPQVEVTKYKLISNTMFGYMETSDRSLLFSRALGIVFGLFMTFMTAKKNQYLLARNYYGDGHWVQLKDKNGNNLYWKDEMREGVINRVLTTENTGEIAYDWEGSMTEGILMSVVPFLKFHKLFTEAGRAKYKEMWADPIKRTNIIIFGEDMLIALLLLIMYKMMTSEYDNLNDEPFGTRAIARILQNTRRDIALWEAFNGVVDFEFTSFSFLKDASIDFKNLLTGESTFIGVLANNITAIGYFKPEFKEAGLLNTDKN